MTWRENPARATKPVSVVSSASLTNLTNNVSLVALKGLGSEDIIYNRIYTWLCMWEFPVNCISSQLVGLQYVEWGGGVRISSSISILPHFSSLNFAQSFTHNFHFPPPNLNLPEFLRPKFASISIMFTPPPPPHNAMPVNLVNIHKF